MGNLLNEYYVTQKARLSVGQFVSLSLHLSIRQDVIFVFEDMVGPCNNGC